MAEILNVQSLNKYFHEPAEFHVLRSISLSVTKGEFVTVLGKSGSGKSTLLYLLATLDTDYTGSIMIENKVVTGLGQNELAKFRNRHIGFVFQSHYLLPEFTVLQNVVIPALKLKNKTPKEVKKEAIDILDQMEMAGYASHVVTKLSGGQQQRVAIARALINNPDIIMADEPTGNLDSINASVILNLFKVLSKQGNTIIAITHDEDFATASDRQLVMIDGALKIN